MTATRPLVDEPLPFDLVDTIWIEGGERHDLFDHDGAVAEWLAGHELPSEAPEAELKERLITARETIRAALHGHDGAEEQLNAVLVHGSRQPRLNGGVAEMIDVVDDPGWSAAWLCAVAYLEFLAERPERIRKCANPACILWFLDTSRNGSRRWCSMEGCGNRAKAGRFHQRHKG